MPENLIAVLQFLIYWSDTSQCRELEFTRFPGKVQVRSVKGVVNVYC